MKEEWTQVDKSSQGALINKINAIHEIPLFSAETTRLQEKPLSFYGDYRLLQATEFSSIPPMTMRFLRKGGEIAKLDGTHDSILHISKKADLLPNEETVVDYVKFYLGAIMTSEGVFRLVKNFDDVEFSADPTEEQVEAIGKAVTAPEVKATEEGFDVSATLLYSDCIYRALVKVGKDGAVDLAEETVLLTGMPTRQIMLK